MKILEAAITESLSEETLSILNRVKSDWKDFEPTFPDYIAIELQLDERPFVVKVYDNLTGVVYVATIVDMRNDLARYSFDGEIYDSSEIADVIQAAIFQDRK